jgi:hypothetical protein
MKTLLCLCTIMLACMLFGCDQLINTVNPAEKLVTANGKVYMACAGSVDVTQNSNGYSVHLLDRAWNDPKTEHTDTDTYLTTVHEVTVRPMTTEERYLCRTGHFRPEVAPQSKETETPEELKNEFGNCLPSQRRRQADGTYKCDTPAPNSGVDCYDANGKLLPDKFADLGGVTVSCGQGQTARPKPKSP